ncbi:alanine--tRNA ligase-related protein [Kitasatospora sp. NPDC048194]|uniref:alanine--tRNA ligase-related protein n=1 Tax=Kitasatospora sp. NPDC048194 TaxID=3364045 RepID=UPI00372367D0
MEQHLAHRLMDQLARRGGLHRVPPAEVIAPSGDSTLFVSAGIQPWREWALSGRPERAGRVGLQWCVRTNRLEAAGAGGIQTAFAMVSDVRRGRIERIRYFEELLTAFQAIGLDPRRLGFLTARDSAGRPLDDATHRALTRLGIPADRLATRPHRMSAPFPGGPFGPNVFVLVDHGSAQVPHRGCTPGCTPDCTCGRWFHFWNCEFLDLQLDGAGRHEPADRPLVDSAGGSERLACAVLGRPDAYTLPALASVHAHVTTMARGDTAGTDTAALLRRVTDHARTAALLLGTGVVPGGKRHGHVLRRILRRAFVAAELLGAAPHRMVGLVALAAAAHRGWPGFPPVPDHRLAMVGAESEAFAALLANGRRAYRDLTHGAAGLTAETVFRLKAERGIPLEIVLEWCRRDGRSVELPDITEQMALEQRTSRVGYAPRPGSPVPAARRPAASPAVPAAGPSDSSPRSQS